MARKFRRVLAVETSCDDSSVAIVSSDGEVEVCLSAHQDLAHAPFGGVVPEIASRNHTDHLLPLIEVSLQKSKRSWDDIDGLVVTARPGLLGSLLVGVVTVKSLALSLSKPWVGVNHVHGHLLAPFLRDEEYAPPKDFAFPYLALAISGGHSHLVLVEDWKRMKVLGHTLDDAAGEAFDKFAKMAGLGFPGGVEVDRWAKQGSKVRYVFPRALIHDDHLNFSFSGLKTAASRVLSGMSPDEIKVNMADLCASYQEAIVDALLAKCELAMDRFRQRRMVLTGGVSANSRLRQRAQDLAAERGWVLAIPPIRYCTDNAAMIGLVGLRALERGEFSLATEGPRPSSQPGDFL